MRWQRSGTGSEVTTTLIGRRVLLRTLVVDDFLAWREVRRRNADWLLKWEPMRTPGAPDPIESRDTFAVRCGARQRERQLGQGLATRARHRAGTL